MKKQIIIGTAAIMLAAIGSGCAGIYNLFGTTPEAVHNAAVEKVSEYAEAAINRKIEKSENLSEEGKAKLKAEVARLKAEILVRIAEIKAKTRPQEKQEDQEPEK